MMQLDALSWMQARPVRQLLAAYHEQQVELRFVGGCVRDALLDRTVTDMDLATSALPQKVAEIASGAGFKAIPTGMDHGTVTVVVEHQPFEITTLRKDVACDGRHAEVRYTDDWQQDASRRDFTMNALYMDADGHITDFFGGIEDAKAGRVTFIGDASQRIQEDGLRMLRFFRFLATHGSAPADEAALAACKQHLAMLDSLSGERINQEMMKLLGAADPAYAIRQGSEIGLFQIVLASEVMDHDGLASLISGERSGMIGRDPLLRLIVLIHSKKEAVQHIIERWKMSNQQKQRLRALADAPVLEATLAVKDQKTYLRRLGRALFEGAVGKSAVQLRVDMAEYTPMLDLAKNWPIPEFPLRGADLKRLGFKPGPALGALLKQLEEQWEASEYQLSKEALLQSVGE